MNELHEFYQQIQHYFKRLIQYPEVKAGFALFCTILNQLFGTFNQPVKILFILIIVDLATGIVKGIKYRRFGSKPLRKSLWKLAQYMVIIFLAYQIQELAVEGFRDLAIFWACFTELTSIVENLDELNFNIPPFIRKVLNREKSNIEKR